ncbi:MAG: hypothetical protein Q8P25_00150 [Candidatus Curtissbacteria bacterium]|nr:hypothetical protein [Candidatus Curtissbacteria bacterium]
MTDRYHRSQIYEEDARHPAFFRFLQEMTEKVEITVDRRHHGLKRASPQPVSDEQLKVFFGEKYSRFTNFAEWLVHERKWDKLCVSLTTETDKETDRNLLYFQILEGERGYTRYIFLGKGEQVCSSIVCGYAAITMGYEFLGLGGRNA